MLSYIEPEGQKHMRNFEYKGACDSITYKHVWSPLAEYLLNYVPQNIAPNLITFTALLIMAVSHLLFVSGVQTGQPIATWRLILMTVSILVYQNMDNLDGKQARRTKMSSPLGMMFDHGVDAVISFLISIQVLAILQVENTPLRLWMISGILMIVYFCAMWSQYSVGYFRLGFINPVDEGLPGYALFALINIFIPHTFWNTPTPLGHYNEVLLVVLSALGMIIMYFMIRENYQAPVRSLLQVNSVLLLPLSYAATLIALYLSSKCPFQQALWPISYCLMFSWSRNMIELQLYYVTKQRYNAFNLGTLGFILPAFLYLFLNQAPNNYFWGVAILSALIFLEFVVSVIKHSARILDIPVFRVKPKAQ